MAPRNSGTTEAAPQESEETTFPGQVTDPEMTPESPAKGKNARMYADTDLRNIKSFDDALALATATLGADSVTDAAEEIGNGFVVLTTDNKARLVGVQFIILSLDFQIGDKGPYVSAMIVTQSGERLILNDGSTGIYAQLDEWAVKSGRTGGLVVNGLRRSEYDIRDNDGQVVINPRTNQPDRGVTFYLNV